MDEDAHMLQSIHNIQKSDADRNLDADKPLEGNTRFSDFVEHVDASGAVENENAAEKNEDAEFAKEIVEGNLAQIADSIGEVDGDDTGQNLSEGCNFRVWAQGKGLHGAEAQGHPAYVKAGYPPLWFIQHGPRGVGRITHGSWKLVIGPDSN